MAILRAVLGASLGLGFLLVFAAAATACTGVGDDIIAGLHDATNMSRSNDGRATLRPDPTLAAAAQRHACDIASRQTVSHRDASGRRPMERLRRSGYQACFTAENLAMGPHDAVETIAAWQASPGHARNQQDSRADSVGFGVARGADGRLWWVGLYAAGCPRVAEGRRGWW